MLGFSATQSSLQQWNHLKQLKDSTDSKLHKQLECAYAWVTASEFQDAMYHDNKDGWEYLKCMEYAPLKIIEVKGKDKDSVCLNKIKYDEIKIETPTCALCREVLAKNICQKVKFYKVSCSCKTLWCHFKCVNAKLKSNNNAECKVCGEVFILSPHYSDIRSTISAHS